MADRKNILEGIRLGADDYLTKPIDYELLLTKVEAVLRQLQRLTKKSDLAVSEFLKHLDEIDSADELASALVEHFSRYGCEYAFIGGPPMPGKPLEPMVFARMWPKGAWEHYRDNNFIIADPVLWNGLKTRAPFHWSEAPLIKGREERGKEILATRARFGMTEGFVIPITANGGTQFVASFCGKHVLVPQSDYMTASIVVHYAFNRLCILRGEDIRRPGELSPREKEVVQWAAFGKTSDDIADILDISSRTVIAHLQHAGEKLHAVNRANLVAEAIRYRQIII